MTNPFPREDRFGWECLRRDDVPSGEYRYELDGYGESFSEGIPGVAAWLAPSHARRDPHSSGLKIERVRLPSCCAITCR